MKHKLSFDEVLKRLLEFKPFFSKCGSEENYYLKGRIKSSPSTSVSSSIEYFDITSVRVAVYVSVGNNQMFVALVDGDQAQGVKRISDIATLELKP